MYQRRETSEAAARRKANRDRDDACPRLQTAVPRLQALHFEVTVVQDGVAIHAADHVKRFRVQDAPASFMLDCTDRTCRDGGHDLTAAVLAKLRAAKERFTVTDTCRGTAGPRTCGRTVQVVAIATYAPAERGAP
jgi:hypothetical protein